jgi:hypothetical protein
MPFFKKGEQEGNKFHLGIIPVKEKIEGKGEGG